MTKKFQILYGTLPYGEMIVEECSIVDKPSLSNYLKAGWKFNLSLAIDFSGTDTNTNTHTTMAPLGQSHYEKIIESVCKIVEPYDSDNLIPAYGFGGIPRGSSAGVDCFPLNNNPHNPEVKGTSGVLEVYKHASDNV